MDAMASGQKLVAFARCGERAFADHVAVRVDRPGDVVQHGDPDEAGPEERGQRTPPGHGDEATEQGGCQQAQGGPERELAADPGDVAVGEQVWGEPGGVGPVLADRPPHVGVDEALGQCGGGGAEHPRGVRVAFFVGEGVVAAVIVHPADDIALQGQAAGDREGVAQPPGWF
jgi:hypothetical protein